MVKAIGKILIYLIILIPIVFTFNGLELKKEENKNQVTDKNGQTIYNLPIVVIDTRGVKIKDRDKIPAVINIYHKKDNGNSIDDEPTSIFDIEIRIRGNSSRNFPKKQYNIYVVDEDKSEKKVKILGMAKSSEWVLNAPFADKSLIRNYMGYSITDKIMPYAPKSEFCEVFLLDDGSNKVEEKHYRGLFLMIEKIKKGEEKVDINSTSDRGAETSFIILKGRVKEGDISIPTYGKEITIYDNSMTVVYPKTKITPEKIQYISRTISKAERVLYSDKYDVQGEGYEEYIDVDSFVDYIIINEFFKNTDAGLYSTFMYKDYGEKIKIGPVWDFNASMGNSNIVSNYYDYTGFYMSQRPWFERLMKDRRFVFKVVTRYKLLRNTYLSDEYLVEFIDETLKLLGDSPKKNFNIWPIYLCNQAQMFVDRYEELEEEINLYEYDGRLIEGFLKDNPELLYPTDGMAESFEEEIDMLKNFIVQRGAWMDKNMESLYKWTD